MDKTTIAEISTIIAGFTSLISVIFGFLLKNKKNTIEYIERNWQELLKDSSDFRDSIQESYNQLKKENKELKEINRAKDLEILALKEKLQSLKKK